MQIVLTTLNAKYTHTSLGLRYLKRFCGGNDNIRLREFTINNTVLSILGQLVEEKPTLVGFLCYIWNIEMTKQLIRLLKKVRPECKIVCGGPEVSYETAAFMQECSEVDYVIRGEGEELFSALLDFLQGRADKLDERIARRLPDGSIAEGAAVVVEDLRRLTFPYTADDIAQIKERIIYYESSRGCPFSCQYCLSCATRGVRFLPLDRVLDELSFFIAAGVRQVKFVDRTFNANKQHYLPIWRFLAAQDCRTNFHFEIAAELLDDEAMQVLSTMPKGRIQLEIGIQSTHEQTLAAVQRKNDWAKLQQVIPALVGFGNIHVHVDLIIGLPYEDIECFARSFNDVYSLKADMVQVGFLKLLKGAGLSEAASSALHEYVFMDKAPYQVLANKYLSYAEIWRLQLFEDTVEQFYNSGRFKNTTDYLISLTEQQAFAFYWQLTDFWHSQGFHLVAHSPKALYAFLYTYAQLIFPQAAANVRELLKLDAMLLEQGRVRAAELGWNEERYNAETSAFLGTEKAAEYIDGYRFTNWRELRKKYHIEVLGIDAAAWLTDRRLVKAKQAVLFFTEQSGAYRVIADEDFWLEEK